MSRLKMTNEQIKSVEKLIDECRRELIKDPRSHEDCSYNELALAGHMTRILEVTSDHREMKMPEVVDAEALLEHMKDCPELGDVEKIWNADGVTK